MKPLAIPTQKTTEKGKECVCSDCGHKVEFVFSHDSGKLVGLTCNSCNMLWHVIAPRYDLRTDH